VAESAKKTTNMPYKITLFAGLLPKVLRANIKAEIDTKANPV
jgi:hypothetical protein